MNIKHIIAAAATAASTLSFSSIASAEETEPSIACESEDCVAVIDPPVVQQINATLVIGCDYLPESGFATFDPAPPVDYIMSVEQTNGAKGGLILDGIVVQAGKTTYEFTATEIAAFADALLRNPSLPMFELWVTTPKGGSNSYYPIGQILTNEECVAVGQPPVPTTEPPAPASAEVWAIKVTASCLDYQVTNIGNVPTNNGLYGLGILSSIDKLPLTPGLMPGGQPFVRTLKPGETMTIQDPNNQFEIDGPVSYTGTSCPAPTSTVAAPPSCDCVLPETGTKTNIATAAAIASGLGLILMVLARRPKVIV